MATKLQVTELDFDDIKNNLKTYMKNQTEFTDYNFEGSGLSTIIDLLAYNTHYLAMNANMAVNEAFLDTATLRSSVVSHAKTLGYTPRSARAPVAYVDVTLNSFTGGSATIAKGTKFTTKVNDSTYGFVVNSAQTIAPVNGITRFVNLPIYEGTLVTAKYTVDSANLDKKYMVTDARADTTTLKVSVQNSVSDTTLTTYSLATDISQVTKTSDVYFLQEVEDGKFEVYFGDGVVGSKPTDGNIVILEYIVTNKDKANGASVFSGTSVGGESDITVATLVSASGGAEPETMESIKYNAPLDYSSQGRAVTTQDYKTIVPQVYADTKAIQVWGGEDNNPPRYGQVYLAIKTQSGINLTQAQKDSIVKLLDGYNIASVRPTIVDPETTKLRLTSNVKFDSKSTTNTATSIETIVTNVLTTYNNSDLQNFDGVFRFSKLSRLIDASDNSILSNITTLKIEKTIKPVLNTSSQYILDYSNALYNPHSGHNATMGGIVVSTGFTIAGNSNTIFIDDDGNGNIRTYYLVGGTSRTYLNNTAGTVDYSTGLVTLPSLTITGTSNSDGTVSVVVQPKSNDVVPVRNQLLEIDFTNTKVTAEVDTIESGGSAAGTGYATSSSY
ncbi:baseplate wedge subunit [Methylophilales phage Melnitz EXVC044M]|nr:baseplate wedge subunit [Methylophilales phage Melnitz-1 EXVC043M]QZI94664.1 baseplate wedge subunit [Methylophilales phage Melnitz-2 EXVC040M]QZI94886.1 baseplate wedge subunit [Methylophilales phage Melnitz EXVC044M]QZI95107.1 baseplate wedge subunit [Methylophilales phage Melnitz-3 EXVC039M]